MKNKIAHLVLISQLLVGSAWAQHAFVVRNIQFQGLQRVSPASAESYLPIKRGQTLPPAKTAAILRSLYQTGFFDQVTLSKEGGTLIIHVVERPTIGQLKITGNSVIATDKLTTVMKSLDIAEGRGYNPAVLEKIKKGLLSQYYQLGRYNARVDITATPMSRNRELVNIEISEGLVAKVRRISIIGNHVYDESVLRKQMDVTTSGLITFVTQTDRYSEEKLDSSVDKIRSYYLDNGYLRAEVKSAQAQVTPDKKSVYITIVVKEGEQYKVESVNLTGDFIIPRAELMKRVTVKPNTIFSRKDLINSEKAITNAYGDKGYMFSSVDIIPNVNDKTHMVALTLNIKAGKRAYVRQVTFSDNTRTNDVVLRREMQQMEAAPASTSRLEESKQRLLLLPYIKEADYTVKPVPGVGDQVDVNYKVKEDNSAQASFKLGYSQNYRTILGAGLNQKNFFGTGNTLGINFSHSRFEQFYGIDFTNPYYTEDGVSRSFNFSLSRVDPGAAGGDNGYTSNEFNLGVMYGVPIGQEHGALSRLTGGVSYQNLLVHLQSGRISNQLSTFITNHTRHFQEADFKLGVSRDSRDRAFFPTRGSINSLYFDAFAPLDQGSISFYTINYSGKVFQPIYDQFILLGKASLGYGNGFHGIKDYPFYKNYYAGGIDTVRGYQNYSLGPKDSNGHSFGANMLADASVGLIFPNYISDNLRTSAFVDGGNVFNSADNVSYGGASTNAGPVHYSVGLEADWMSPFGPIEVSVAHPLNLNRNRDESDAFQFALGANF